MKRTVSGLTDSDKIFVVIALWISMVGLFVTALTLPMLPDNVTIFYKTTDMEAEYYSKYNNLLIVFVSIIPAVIIIAAALFRHYGKMKHNFQSIILFSIVLSGCMSGICAYGITKQFDASSSIRDMNVLNIIALGLALLLSVWNALGPMLIHSPTYKARATNRKAFAAVLADSYSRYWAIGAMGFLFAGIISSFIMGALSFVPVAVCFVAYLIFLFVISRKHMKHKLENMLYDALDA